MASVSAAAKRSAVRAGLALVAAFAATALFAPSALAQNGRVSAKGPFFLAGRALKGGTMLSYPLGEEVTCRSSRQRWAQVGSGGPLRSSSSVFTVVPTYSGCTAARGLFPATVAMYGCHYIFHIGETVNVKEYELTAGLSCPAGRRPVIHLFLSSEAGSFLICTVHLSSRPKITGAKLLDEKGNKALVEGTMTGLHDSMSGLCGFSSSPTVRYWIRVELKGVNVSGQPTEVAIND